MHGVNLSLDWFSSVMALVTDSSRGRNVGCACQDLAWPLYPFERYYFDELHGLAGDTAQLHIGTNLTRHLTDRLHVPCSTKVNGRKNPSIARLNKPTAAETAPCDSGVPLLRMDSSYESSSTVCGHALTRHGVMPGGGYDRTNPVQAPLCDVNVGI